MIKLSLISFFLIGSMQVKAQTFFNSDHDYVAFLRYMTAKQMQLKLYYLTGYQHPDFIVYEKLLGGIDPTTGNRTVERPNVIARIFLKRIAASVAGKVIDRELFLDASERMVFSNIQFDEPTCFGEFDSWIAGIFHRWLGSHPSAPLLEKLRHYFLESSQNSCINGYQKVLELMLQHGGLYYY